MDSTVDYFYRDELRWSFGFDNPNKAAVIFACLLPLLWSLWNAAWRIGPERKALKIIVLLTLSGLIVADAFCLFETFSRGGVVAAAAGLFYMLIRSDHYRKWYRWPRHIQSADFYWALGLMGVLAGIFIWIGLGNRSLEPVTAGDASVGHRLTLWRSALQMAVENPMGFGTGKSGEAYMQWYQALDSRSSYRTMVNSYLTFLVEQGWLWFSIIFFVTILFWFWCLPGKAGLAGFNFARGLRASILAFLVSGIFSTVMEEPTLWIIPMGCALILTVWSVRAQVSLSGSKAVYATAFAALALLTLFLAGLIRSRADPLTRTFANRSNGSIPSELALKEAPGERKIWTVVPDEKVLGRFYGKLLRQMVLETGMGLRLENASGLSRPVDRLLLVGDALKATPVGSTISTVLLCPSQIPESDAQAWLSSSPHLMVLSSAMDEDSRGRLWQDYVASSKSTGITTTTLKGVGLRVDWAWGEIIKLIKDS